MWDRTDATAKNDESKVFLGHRHLSPAHIWMNRQKFVVSKETNGGLCEY